MPGISSLNNRRMRSLRRDPVYEAVMTDLYLIGALDKSVVEQLLGKTVSEHLVSPLKVDTETTRQQVVDE